MKKLVCNGLLYMLLSLILSCVLSLVITKVYGYGFCESLFWFGIILVAVGGMSSITGNPTGTRIFSGTEDTQYQSFANIESLRMERESTGFYVNFKKNAIFHPMVSGIGLILAGAILIVLSSLF